MEQRASDFEHFYLREVAHGGNFVPSVPLHLVLATEFGAITNTGSRPKRVRLTARSTHQRVEIALLLSTMHSIVCHYNFPLFSGDIYFITTLHERNFSKSLRWT